MFNKANLQKLISLIFIILLTSCGYVIKNNANAISFDCKGCSGCEIYFTQKVRRELEYTGINIKNIQYYNSSEIILSRSISKKHMSSSEGVLKYKSGKLKEEIIINKMTPGICICNDTNILYMSFSDDTRLALPFEKKNGYYQLSHQNGYITVNNIRYKVEDGQFSVLKFQKDERKTREIRKETLEGRLITSK